MVLGRKELFAPIDTITGGNTINRRVNKPSNEDKWRYTLCTTFLFLLITNPNTYKLTSSISGIKMSVNGCPTTIGLYTHALVFTLLLRLMMG
jgi:hypothetical protein